LGELSLVLDSITAKTPLLPVLEDLQWNFPSRCSPWLTDA